MAINSKPNLQVKTTRNMKTLILLMTTLLLFSCNNRKKLENTNETTSSQVNEKNLLDTSEYIIYGQSFGMCLGYCHIESIYSAKEIITTSTSFRDPEKQPQKVEVTASNVASYQQLLNLVNFEDFLKLPKIIGCPDCADGGASWIQISHRGKKHTVHYEFGEVPVELVKLEAKIKLTAE